GGGRSDRFDPGVRRAQSADRARHQTRRPRAVQRPFGTGAPADVGARRRGSSLAAMTTLPDVDVYEADVLVIGGGFAGTFAALRAAELADRVILAEKAYVSRAGASVMSGGVTCCPLDGDDLDAWAEEFIVRGAHMGHQAWAKQLLEGQRQRVKEL